MDKIHQAINQHLEELPRLYQTLADTRKSLGGLSASALNEMQTYVISAQAATTRLEALLSRFPGVTEGQALDLSKGNPPKRKGQDPSEV